MKKSNYIEDITLADLPLAFVKYLDVTDVKWYKMPAEERLEKMKNFIDYCLRKLRIEEDVFDRKHIRNLISVMREYCKYELRCESVYCLYKNDKLETLVYLGDTLSELSKVSNIPCDTLTTAYYRNYLLYGKYKVKRVELYTPDEKFNFARYKHYCFKNKLKPQLASSLDKFRSECYGNRKCL